MTEFTPEWITKARNACIFFGEPATTEFRNALDHIERLQKRVEEVEDNREHIERLLCDAEKRIAELEQERRWIHQDKTMIVKKDGDSWCFVLPDFINLQESEAKFMDSVLSSFIDRIYTNLLPNPPKDGE